MSRFRMTADRPETWWKLPAYEMKPNLVGGWHDDDGGIRQEGWTFDSVPEYAKPVRYQLPDHLLPVVLEVDPTSEEDVLRFVQTYGPLGVTMDEIREGVMTDVDERPEDFDGTGIRTHYVRPFGHFVYATDQQAAIASLRRAQLIAAELENDTFNIRALFGLGDPWLWNSPPRNKKAAEHQLHWIINTGLSGFELRLKHGELVLEPPWSLFAIACLELVDASSKRLPWRRCARDKCDRLFLPNRHDQVFHDAGCAQAIASRNYRLRERGKKEKGDG